MRSIRTKDLIESLQSSLAVSGAEDLFYYWLEEALTIIREQPWNWNWKKVHGLTYSSTSEPVLTFTWTEGNDYILCSANVTLGHANAGRWVLLGDQWYKAVDFGHTNPLRVYVDRPILGSQATATTVKFYRVERSIQTSRLRTVEVDAEKITRYSRQYFTKEWWGTTLQMDVGTTMGYTERDDEKIDPPAYPPVVVAGPASAAMPAGKYLFFYTRYDPESGLESAPGPQVEFTSAGAVANRVTYGNPVADRAESKSYQLRLYRSVVNYSRDRVPMFLLQTRDPSTAGAPFDDTNSTVYNLPRYYDGPYATLFFLPPPDDTRASLMVECQDNWSGRLYEEEYLNLGTNNQVLELCRVFLTSVINLASRNTAEYRAAVIHFRQQLNYLITMSEASGHGDYGPENRNHDVPGPNNTASDWVEALRWDY